MDKNMRVNKIYYLVYCRIRISRFRVTENLNKLFCHKATNLVFTNFRMFHVANVYSQNQN